jgi:hypothetical protein
MFSGQSLKLNLNGFVTSFDLISETKKLCDVTGLDLSEKSLPKLNDERSCLLQTDRLFTRFRRIPLAHGYMTLTEDSV